MSGKEVRRGMVDQFSAAMVLKLAVKYQDVALEEFAWRSSLYRQAMPRAGLV
jgi:hypothetical protein